MNDEYLKAKILNNQNNKPFYFLFDVDDTITKPKSIIDKTMVDLIKKLSSYTKISFVGGGTYKHIYSQTEEIINCVEFILSENGTVVYKNGNLLLQKNLSEEVGEDILNKLISFLLLYMSTIDIPFKRGTFIEYRSGLLNISPVGKNCTLEERDLFHIYDKENHILSKFKNKIDEYLKENQLDDKIISCFGGKISVDIFPKQWNKSYCLQYIDHEIYNIIFIGDRIFEGGNDYEVAIDKRVFGYYKVNHQPDTVPFLEWAINCYENKLIKIK